MKIPLVAFFIFLLFSGAVQAGDEVWINEDLKANAGSTYTLPAGTFNIEAQIQVPADTVFQGTIGENGERLTVLFLDANAKLEHQESMILLTDNTKMFDLFLDGNSANRDVPIKKGKKTGNGYDNLASAQGAENIEVANCYFYNNNGDGLRVNRCKNVYFHDNEASEGGHDVFYQLRSEGLIACNNTFFTRVNSALRAMDCSHLRWYNNYISTDGEKGTGLAMQIQHDGQPMEDLEVCNNVIVDSYGPGLWLVGKTGGNEELWLHHNLFLNCGYNPDIYWVGGIIASGYGNARIENNVFDGSYLSAVTFWDYSHGSWSSSATAYLDSNIFTDSRAGIQSGEGGYGINNEISKQTVISSNNCYWGNDVDTKGCSVSDTDLFIDPKTNETPSGWRWTGTTWECDSVKPSEMGEIEDLYDNVPDLTDEELEEYEFINLKDLEFSETGYVEQGEIKANKKWESKGKYTAAYIFLAGYNGQVTFQNQSFIPVPASECAIVKYDTKNLAPHAEGQTSELTLSDAKDGSLKVKLEVETKYKEKKYKTYNVLGVKFKVPYWDKKSETVTYTKTYPAPPQFPKIGTGLFNVTVEYYNSSYNPYSLVTVQENENQTQFNEIITFIEYNYKGNTAKEFRQIGYVSINASGFKRTYFKETNTWKFSSYNLTHSSRQLYIKGPLDLNSLEIIVHTPYTQTKVTDISYTEIRESTSTFFEKMKQLFWIILFFAPFLFSISSEFKICFGRFRG